MDALENASIEELKDQIQEYESQLATLESSLAENPEQEDLLEVKAGLLEVLTMTKDCLRLQTEVTSEAPKYHDIADIANKRGIFIGMKCEALWSVDNKWYKATVTEISTAGFHVVFQAYGNSQQTVGPDAIRPVKLQDVVVVDHTKKGGQVTSKNVLVVDSATGELVLPPSLKILPTDPEHIRKAKKKGIKALKNEHRKIQTEDVRNKRKSEWQNFQNKGKVSAAKKRKTGSIFQSPEGVEGKVGVTGSGKAMTSYTTQKYEPKKLQSSLPVATKRDT